MKRIAATFALGLLVALLVGTGVASAGSAGNDSASGRVADAHMITLVPQPCIPIPFPPFCQPQPPRQVVTATAEVVFNAKSSFNGTDPTGSARFIFSDQDPNQVFKGDVTCLNVQGGFATLSGPITEARGGSTLTVEGRGTYEPLSFKITAFDTGKSDPNPDLIAFELSPQPATADSCNTPLSPLDPVRDGEVVVEDAL
jgi:hypothetical protein